MQVGDEIIVSSYWGDRDAIKGMAGTITQLDPECGVMFYYVTLQNGDRVNLQHCEMICLNNFQETYEVD